MSANGLPSKVTEHIIAIIALLLLAAGCIVVLHPFFSAILWAILLCFSTWPAFDRLTEILHGRRSLASFLMVLGLTACIVMPFVLVGASLADNVRDVVGAIRRIAQEGFAPVPAWLINVPLVGSHLVRFWNQMAADPVMRSRELRELIEPLQEIALRGGRALAHGILQISLSLLIAFFLYRDGSAAVDRLGVILYRIAGERSAHLMKVASSTVKGVVYGVIGTSLLQGVVAGVGFWIAGVPGAFLLGFMSFLVSFLPSGPALLWLPAAAWLYKQGTSGWAIFIIVWGLGPVGMIDHLLKPILISRNGDAPLIMIILGVLGGAIAFGFIGVFIGPGLLAVGYSLVQEWRTDSLEAGYSSGPLKKPAARG
jgi:predicted PurR-regulated permease PerM